MAGADRDTCAKRRTVGIVGDQQQVVLGIVCHLIGADLPPVEIVAAIELVDRSMTLTVLSPSPAPSSRLEKVATHAVWAGCVVLPRVADKAADLGGHSVRGDVDDVHRPVGPAS